MQCLRYHQVRNKGTLTLQLTVELFLRFYADNEAEMIAKLTDAIKQVVSGSLTFNNPAIMSDVQKGDFIYQSTFKYEKINSGKAI